MIFGVWISVHPWRLQNSLKRFPQACWILNIALFAGTLKSMILESNLVSCSTTITFFLPFSSSWGTSNSFSWFSHLHEASSILKGSLGADLWTFQISRIWTSISCWVQDWIWTGLFWTIPTISSKLSLLIDQANLIIWVLISSVLNIKAWAVNSSSLKTIKQPLPWGLVFWHLAQSKTFSPANDSFSYEMEVYFFSNLMFGSHYDVQSGVSPYFPIE